MLRIKRTKGTPPAIHYATSVAPAGNVTGWTATVAKAATFTPEVVGKVKDYYARRENVGTLTFDSVDPPPAPPMPVVETPKPVPVTPPDDKRFSKRP